MAVDIYTKAEADAYIAAQLASKANAASTSLTATGTPQVHLYADNPGITLTGANPSLFPNAGSFGGNATLDATAGNRGAIVAAARNGRAVLRMDGGVGSAGDYVRMQFSSQTDPKFHVMCAGMRTLVGTDDAVFSAVSTGSHSADWDGTNRFVVEFVGSAVGMSYYRNSAEQLAAGAAAPDAYAPFIIDLMSDGERIYLSLNGLLKGTATLASTNLAVTDLFFFAGWVSTAVSRTLGGDFYEGLAYFGANVMSPANIAAERARLSKKWAIPIAGVPA
jgi:hypothetical protein